ncbi:hypothetical protein CC99x_007150 [Candidatus Berkiella cookevillensis]|uniref:Uncharacterized protein n=1 Tax=Candidatus Berkiella cookevillensis TaxID=437022 RepID=A0A0Q9YEV0_9GAMM|nr:hypothetical protein [Candidatus Berkiella cookevillensis]MCS5708683.1 hypothetical protein [Candidatus Berkiella cookevillensis]
MRWNTISPALATRLAALLNKPIAQITLSFYCESKDAVEAINTALENNESITHLNTHLLGPDVEYQYDIKPRAPAKQLEIAHTDVEASDPDSWTDSFSTFFTEISNDLGKFVGDATSVVSDMTGRMGNNLLTQFRNLNLSAACSSVTCIPTIPSLTFGEDERQDTANRKKCD